MASQESVSSMELGHSATAKAVTTTESTANHLQRVVAAFSQITDQATQISIAASEQKKVSQELSMFVSRLQEMTDSNASDASNLSDMSQEIDAIAQRLITMR